MSIFATLKRGGRWPAVIGACAVAVFTVLASANPAEAARKKRFRGGYNPPYAAMVIDAKTGRTLHAVNENALRHPASITKVMTLYMLFEQMERGRFSMASPLRVSSYAAARPPSKLGLKAGETIDVEDAIMALITKSANDVAVVVAENVAGNEDTFAEQMTRRARALGMSRTVFTNASGLPDSEQVTTARDLTILARAIQERFPRQYHLFQARNFEYAGRNYRNHNKLLGRVEGVDGIKTGYTRNSGFNLMTSAKADGRHIVSIVLGGRSGSARDQIMANLVVAHLPRAANGPRTSLVAQLPESERETEPARRAPSTAERPRVTVAAAEPVRAAAREVQEVAAPAPAIRAAVRPLDLAQIRPVAASTTAQAFAAPTPTSTSAPAMRWSAGASAAIAGREIRPPAPVAKVDVPKIVVEPVQRQAASGQPARPAPVVAQPAAIELPSSRLPAPRPPANVQVTSSIAKAPEKALMTGWVIQLGATDDEGKAKGIISNAKAKTRSLADARGFTETVERGGATLFRARFAGFDDQSDANNACRDLKRNGFSCFAVRG
jgi:D-alanyl-D-alanine carboxypeptidase